MKSRILEIALFALVSLIFGATLDFLFNGVAMRLIFHSEFSEKWSFIYIPMDFAIAMAMSSLIVMSRWRDYLGAVLIAFLCGILVCHCSLANREETRTYQMRVVSPFPLMLRSRAWPQVLFIRGDAVHAGDFDSFLKKDVPVKISVVTDYGCIRSFIVTAVGGLNVLDERATWTWRLNQFASTLERDGPGMEDLRFPWCRHLVREKAFDAGPAAIREWDKVLQMDTMEDK